MNVNRLEKGFRAVYGLSVYQFLKDYKMKTARRLFMETAMNVSEVAWRFGYVNVSHFGAAFRKKYGVRPKQFINGVRG